MRSVQIDIDGPISYQDKNKMKGELSYVYPQEPNTYIFNIVPFKSFLYNLRYQRYQSDSLNFQIVNRIVEKPSIYQADLWNNIPDLMTTYFKNQGFFDTEVETNIVEKRKKVFVNYDVNTHSPYIISEHEWAFYPKELEFLKNELEDGSLLKLGDKYQHATLEAERKRIISFLRNKGYYGLTLDHVRFELDTIDAPIYKEDVTFFDYFTLVSDLNVPKKYIKVFSYLTDTNVVENESKALQPYTIQGVNIFSNYSGYGTPNKDDYQVAQHHNHQYYFIDDYINPEVIDRHLFLRKGNLFSEETYSQTLRQLSDLGVFRYSAIHLKETEDQSLDVDIYLEPLDKYDFNTSIELSGGDLYTVGSALQVSLINKNFLRGANRLSGTISYGVELEQNKQLSDQFFKQFFLYSQNIGLNFKLEFPKFVLPINPERFSRRALPTTSINLGGNYMQRFQYFKLFNISSSLQYHWRETAHTSWTVTPIYINSLHLRSVDPSFQMRMDSIPAIKNAYQESFIHGERVEFLYQLEKSKHLFLSRVGFEEAGLIVGSFQNLLNADHNKIAQFIRFDWDSKWYKQFRNSQLVFRFQGGIGKPYGNSSVLPYIKQFYVGGPYSIRGWLPRYLGPGSYNVQNHQSVIDHLFMDQAGDIKLELNAEYRFPLMQLFRGSVGVKGAGFVDAGNIWLSNEDEMLPGAQFKFSELGQDIAISTGAGLRLDLGGIFVLRLDWAFPIKKPHLPQNYGWITNEIDFLSKSWRKENINLNIAIGYPF